MFHIGLTPEQGAEYAILTGDPGRVESIARLLDEPAFLASKREYTSWSGQISGRRVLVISHGIGGPSTAICVEELARCGVSTMIRVGTCGGMAIDVCGGDLVISNAAIRQRHLANTCPSLPAVSDFGVTSALAAAAVKPDKGSYRSCTMQGFPLRAAQARIRRFYRKTSGKPIYRAAVWLRNGKRRLVYHGGSRGIVPDAYFMSYGIKSAKQPACNTRYDTQAATAAVNAIKLLNKESEQL